MRKSVKRFISFVALIAMLIGFVPAFDLPASALTEGDYTYTVENGQATITGYTGSATDLTIPSTLGGYPVTAIGVYAFFDNTDITEIIIPEGLTEICDSAFEECCNLTSVTIPGSVIEIGNSVFSGCTSLTSVTIPERVTWIGSYAFYGCSSLISIVIPKGVTGMGSCAFYGCSSLTDISIPESLYSIGRYGFGYCTSLTDITFPEGVTRIGEWGFCGCSALTEVTIPNSITTISNEAFSGCESLVDVHYDGSKTDRDAIDIGTDNTYLLDATWHYAIEDTPTTTPTTAPTTASTTNPTVPPVSAAANPILVLKSTTAVNPILDHVLSAELFSTGGPFTVTFDWKAVGIKDNDASDPGNGHAFVGVVGTIYGTLNNQSVSAPSIKGTTDWEKVSFQFQNVGTYPLSGTNMPGNILRFGLWKAKGELHIRNVVITDANGTVKYSLNTDPVVAQAVANTRADGLTECDLSELAAIDYENTPWTAGQYSTGSYYASLRYEDTDGDTTTPTTAPTTKPTTTPTTQPTTALTTAPITRPTVPPASAAVNPILVLGSTTAVNPLLDHILSADLFASGGPFTVTFDWKAVGIKDNDASDPGAGEAFVGVTGTIYGTLNNQSVSAPSIKGTTDWEKVSFQFQNVGTYPQSGSNYPGNILRFGMWKAKGELHIRNVVITDANGTVKYSLNTDPVVAQAVANTRADGLTECGLTELAAIDYENCPWTAGQYSTGSYYASLRYEVEGSDTTTPTTAPTTKPTTAPTTKPTTAPTTQPSLENLYATLSVDKSTYAPGETVTFTIDANGIRSNLWIYRVDGQWQNYYEGVVSTYTLSFGWEGVYKALIETWCATGSVCSEYVYFTVGDASSSYAPTYATIGADKSVYKIGDTVVFSMATDGESNTLWIYKPDGTSEYFHNAGSSYTYIPTMAGQYEALVDAWNSAGSFCSERIKFRVVDPNASATTQPTTAPTTKPTTAPTTKPTVPPASAAVNPVLVLGSTTAVNPILDHILSADLFSTGGPFTVTFDWKAVGIKDNDPSDPGAGHALVAITGTVYGTQNNQADTGLTIKGTTDWQSESFTFQNVGTYPVSVTNMPGNILRFMMWKAKGELHIRNLVIKSANGTVKYSLNTDPIVAQAVANTRAQGLTECDLSELAAIDYNCPWNAGQFSTGSYYASLRYEVEGSDTTTPTTAPTTQPTTKPTTAPTTAPTTKPTVPPASAAVNPVLVLGSTTAVHPILDHILSADLFASGGPFTVTFDWKAVGVKDNDASDPGSAHAFVSVVGTAYGQTTGDNVVTGKPSGIRGTTDWSSVSFTFQNVGCYNLAGTNIPGNILRFGLWKAKGELHIRNLVIKSANGTVKYSLNTDPVVAQAVAQTQAQGLTECDLSELAAIDYDNCPWNAGQFSTGSYYASVRYETSESGSETTTRVEGDYRYGSSDGEATIIEYLGEGGNVVIPETLAGLPVVRIAGEAFDHCSALRSISIPGSVRYIGCRAFSYCTSLNTVYISDGVTSIEDYAFMYCFNLQSITIPKSLTSIGNNAFVDCRNLTGITVDSENPTFYIEDGCLITKETKELVWGCRISVIPYGVTRIRSYALCDCSSIAIPDTVTRIDESVIHGSTTLKAVFYAGTWEQKNAITNMGSNGMLTNATWHYLSRPAVFAERDCYYCAECDKYLYEDGITNVKAKVTFLDWDGTPISTQYYKWKDAITEPADPTRAADNTYTYTFAGWDKEVVACDGNATYTATYTSTLIDYTVKFVDWDGTVISTETYNYGDEVIIPADPTRAADNTYTYTFDGWDKDVVACDGNATYTATYTGTYIDYIVWFENWDGTVISIKKYHYGDEVTVPADPTRAADNTYTYTFAGWDKEVVACDGDATYTATYTSTFIDYTVKFVDWDGAVISTKTYHYGDEVSAPTDPVKAADNTYTYTFAGWDKEVVVCDGDATYTATYTGTYIDYTVKFVNWDGAVISILTYHYGDAVTAPADPARAADNTYTYSFAGWDKDVVVCDGNATYTATYTGTYIDYIVWFENWDGTVISIKEYHYGDIVTVPANPAKAPDNAYTYTFAGWDKDVVACDGNATYTATYTSAYIDYTVKFVDWDGTAISTKTYHYGDAVTVPANPAKAPDNAYIYTFAGWDKEVVACDGNATYTATYTSAYIDYTVKFVNWDGTVISAKTYHYGDEVSAPIDPVKAADSIYTYTFTGWDANVTNCYGNATYTAIYERRTILQITTQPKGAHVAEGATAEVTVKATGDGLKYTWYIKNAGGSKFSKSSITAATYTVAMSEKADGRQIYCVITDKYGNSVKTNTVTITMKIALKITGQPKDVCVKNGGTATVKVTAVGEGLTYKWYFKDAGASSYKLTTSFTGNTYTTTMTDARAGRRVLCKIYDKYGNMVQTKSVLLTQPVRITKQPANVCVEYGETVTIKVVAKGEGLTYKWYFKDAGASSYKLTTSFTGNTYTTTMTDARSGRRVLCKIYDKYGNMVQSNSVVMNQAVRITKQPASVTVKKGATAKITVTAKGDGLIYEWFYKNPGGKFTYTPSFKGNTYSVKMDASRHGRQVYCVVTDKYGNFVESKTVTLRMK